MRPGITRHDGPVIVGAGLAGLFTALKLAPAPVTVLTPEPLGEGASSAWAQGGVAAALREDDSAEAHATDTVRAGAGTVDITVAASVAEEAKARIEDLARLGTPFDREPGGAFVQSREAAHSAHRVVRVKGDTAGRAIMTALIEAVRATPSIEVVEGVTAESLVLSEGRVAGVVARGAGGAELHAGTGVVLATGGIGGLYAVTSNPARVAAQGLGMAARAGAEVQDPEFVQFHPTGLDVETYPTPLASEALRGEGAVLIDETGARIMARVEGGDLAARDVVARALHRHIAAGHRCFLDTRAALGAEIDTAFPTIAAACRAAGIDPVAAPIPVRPIQHYHMGGVRTDARARTTLSGLWAIGEVACTGLHGANRLASNSLLEALVYGARAAADLGGEPVRPAPETPGIGPARPVPERALAELRQVMTADVGVERSAEGLSRALARIAALEGRAEGSESFLNMTASATLIAAAALGRRETRGGHVRLDCPATDPALAHPTRITLAEAMRIRAAAVQEPVA